MRKTGAGKFAASSPTTIAVPWKFTMPPGRIPLTLARITGAFVKELFASGH